MKNLVFLTGAGMSVESGFKTFRAKNKDLKEKVLVQGIIDLYFEENDGKLVILDYKTDTVVAGEEEKLANKHREQLIMYKNALEEATKKVVKEMYIYSTCLDKVIRINTKNHLTNIVKNNKMWKVKKGDFLELE